eukprot:m51a1_g5427 hypothetical protein (184) ;mRNA; r:148591-149254
MGQTACKSAAEFEGLAKETQFSAEGLAQLHECFRFVDSDGSGEIDRPEFESLWRHVPALASAPRDRLDACWKAVDADGSGAVSFEELARALSKVSREARLKELFASFDADGSAELQGEEIERLRQQFLATARGVTAQNTPAIEEFVSRVVKTLDVNGDGSISVDEWLAVSGRNPTVLLFLGVF